MFSKARGRGRGGRRKRQDVADADERSQSTTPSPTPGERSRSITPPPPAVVDADDIIGEDQVDHDDAFTSASTSASTIVGKGGAAEKKPRKNFTLPTDDEDVVFEWLQENELLWRRGHKSFKDTNRKRAMWQAKGSELEVTAEHLQGWWRGMHTWYVKLHRVKSGQAAKRFTDRERHILQKCAFYEGELRHRSSAPMKSVSPNLSN